MMRIVSQYFKIVDPTPPFDEGWLAYVDQDDVPIWAAAKLIQADYVVSNNTNDFPPKNKNGRHLYKGIEYITVEEFLEIIGFEPI